MPRAFKPQIGQAVYIHPSSQVIGKVKIGDYSSVWPCAVIRGDINRIEIGRYSNIQDVSVLHVEKNKPCIIGNYVTVGHRVILHACKVEDQTLIGMGSIVLDGAVIGKGVILGAASLVTQGQRLEPAHLYFGSPAKKIRKLSRQEIAELKAWAVRYAGYSARYREGCFDRL